jgi:hypothetical protein
MLSPGCIDLIARIPNKRDSVPLHPWNIKCYRLGCIDLIARISNKGTLSPIPLEYKMLSRGCFDLIAHISNKGTLSPIPLAEGAMKWPQDIAPSTTPLALRVIFPQKMEAQAADGVPYNTL